MKIKNFKFQIIFLLSSTFFLLSSIVPVSAINMSNTNYRLQMGTFNTAGGLSTGDSNKINITLGETAPGLYSGDNYKVRAGFQYISSIIKFRFTITEQLVDFGVLTPGTAVTRTHSLIVTNGSAAGYSVTATESSQLLNPTTGEVIPDTTCDDGTCTQTTSAAWTSALTYGFGYRCDNETGTDCASGFSDSTYYKQFPDSSKNEAGQSVMSGTNVGKNKRVRITYKANIATTQQGGFYRNFVNYVATPTF